MSHTLHRHGHDRESLEHDFIVFAIAAQTVNAKGIHPEFKKFEEIVRKYNPVNYGDMTTGNIFTVEQAEISARYKDNSIVHAVFTDEEVVAQVLSELATAGLKLSIVVSGLLDSTADCCHKAGIEPHTVEYSMGIWGMRDKYLPEEAVIEISTMCGHGMIAFSLIESLVEKIKKGRLTPKAAAEKLAALCHCGIFNPARAEVILTRMTS